MQDNKSQLTQYYLSHVGDLEKQTRLVEIDISMNKSTCSDLEREIETSI